MKTFITSDTHWYHTNIMKFCPDTRKYTDVDHMNQSMIDEWNDQVQPGDLVYHLGDFAFCSAEKARGLLARLNGRKILVTGNHDVKLLRDPGVRKAFESVHDYLKITHNGQLVIMFHYPIHYEWDQAHRGSVHFYGHVHGKKVGLEEFRARDVGVDATGRVVSDLDYMIADALKGKIPDHH